MTYEDLGKEIGALTDEKNRAYGASFSKAGAFLRLLFGDKGIPDDKLDDALTLVRMFDKQMRIATDKDALGEDPYRDIAGYALLAVKSRAKADDPAVEEKPEPRPQRSPEPCDRCRGPKPFRAWLCWHCFYEDGTRAHTESEVLRHYEEQTACEREP